MKKKSIILLGVIAIISGLFFGFSKLPVKTTYTTKTIRSTIVPATDKENIEGNLLRHVVIHSGMPSSHEVFIHGEHDIKEPHYSVHAMYTGYTKDAKLNNLIVCFSTTEDGFSNRISDSRSGRVLDTVSTLNRFDPVILYCDYETDEIISVKKL